MFDLVVQRSTGEEIIIEMQTSTYTNLKKRMLYYANKVISDAAPKRDRKSCSYAIPEVYHHCTDGRLSYARRKSQKLFS